MLSQEYFEYPGIDVANASLNVNFGLDVHEQVGLKHECCSMVLQVAAFELGCTAGRSFSTAHCVTAGCCCTAGVPRCCQEHHQHPRPAA